MIEDIYNWLTVAGVPPLGSIEQFNLWKKLMLEEIQEMEDAFNNYVGTKDTDNNFVKALHEKSIEEIKDAYADLIVVNTNLPFMLGIPVEQLEQKIQDVSKSNWSKFCLTEDIADKTVIAYKNGKHWTKPNEIIDCYWEKVGDLYIIKRTSDNKILKALSYFEP